LSKERGGRPVLVCLPHAGGNARYFRPLAEALGSAVEVLAVQYPGRQERLRDPHPGTIAGLVEGVVNALPPGPYGLFGHSMGAVVGYEVARRVPPVRLYVSGRPAPGVARIGPEQEWGDEELLADLARLGGTEEAGLTDPRLLRLVLPATRADYLAVDRHPEPADLRLDCPVTALVGAADPEATVAETAAWEAHSAPGFRLAVFPGGHFYLDDCWDQVAALIAPDS
jgi:surfactin synthase thioesterase subunit